MLLYGYVIYYFLLCLFLCIPPFPIHQLVDLCILYDFSIVR